MHWLLKQELKSCNSSLLALYRAIQKFSGGQQERYRQVHNEDGFKMPDRADRKALYGIVLRRASVKATQFMQEQEALANDAIKENRAGQCTIGTLISTACPVGTSCGKKKKSWTTCQSKCTKYMCNGTITASLTLRGRSYVADKTLKCDLEGVEMAGGMTLQVPGPMCRMTT